MGGTIYTFRNLILSIRWQGDNAREQTGVARETPTRHGTDNHLDRKLLLRIDQGGCPEFSALECNRSSGKDFAQVLVWGYDRGCSELLCYGALQNRGSAVVVETPIFRTLEITKCC
jgi:hypothetical protein